MSICCSHAGRDPVSGKKSNMGGIFLCHVAGELYGHRKLLLAEEATDSNNLPFLIGWLS